MSRARLGGSRRPLAFLSLAGLVLGAPCLPGLARASTFDTPTGTVTLGAGAVRAVSFEDTNVLRAMNVKVAKWNARSFLELDYSDATPEALSALVAEGKDVSIEGSWSLRIGKDSKGLVFFDKSSFDAVKGSRFEVTFWSRADGIAPSFFVAYGRTDEDVYTKDHFPFAQVRALRTGVQTSDGWAEYSTGALDGEVFGVGVRAIGFVPRSVDEGDTFLLDALEIRKVDDAVTKPELCTQDDVAKQCGPAGDCMYGHCVPSTVTWGPLPTKALREELAERWIHVMTKIHGDRNSVALANAKLVKEARRLAAEATSSRIFVGGLARLVNETRDNHTSFGAPSNFTYFGPQLTFASSSGLGCFGVVEKDLLGGGMGYAVFNVTPDSRLKPGDVLASIDGQDPKAWIDKHYPSFVRTLPNDPRSDWGESASSMAELLVSRAKTFTVTRCESASSCEGAARTQVTLDVGELVYQAILSGETGGGGSIACTARFRNAVKDPQTRSQSGEDNVNVEVQPSGEVSVQFDGFSGQGGWEAQMNGVFKDGPAKVLMDAREGHGGYYSAIDYLFSITRGASEPYGVVSVGRGGHDTMDPTGLFTSARTCTAPQGGNELVCVASNVDGFFSIPGAADPLAMRSKIAWLNTVDVSANDYMPKLLQGRSKFRVFAPHPTAGAFGAVIQLPSYLSGFQGGSIQIQDSRFGKTLSDAQQARWESGHGVEPDEVVVQKQSDILLGEDTILKAARTWLEAP